MMMEVSEIETMYQQSTGLPETCLDRPDARATDDLEQAVCIGQGSVLVETEFPTLRDFTFLICTVSYWKLHH